MNPAALTSMIFGALLLLLYGGIAWKGGTVLSALENFPRSVWPGRILTAVCLVWFARNLWQVDLGGFNDLKKLLYAAVPVGIYLVIVYIPDLLSVRGVCGLVLLGAQPLLVATRWTGTPASLAVGIVTYVLLVKCMVLIVYPHLWKRSLRWWRAHEEVQLPGLLLGGAVGMTLLVCGVLSL